MAVSGLLPRPTYTRRTPSGELVTAPISQRSSIRKLPTEGWTSLQAMYGAGYEKKGFSFTPLDLLPVATQLVPGGQLVGAALGMTQGGTMNGWDPWIGVGGGYGLGWCPPPNRCVGGVSAAGVCLGSCVPPSVTQPIQPLPEQLPIGPINGGGQVPVPVNGGQVVTSKLCCPTGYHPNRSAYFTRGIRDGLGPRWVPKGSQCVRNRRVNPLNPDALSRAGSRLYRGKQANKWLAKVQVPKRRR